MPTHTFLGREYKTACEIDVIDGEVGPVIDIHPTCPICAAYLRVDLWIKQEQLRLIQSGMAGEEALRATFRQLSDEDQAAWLCMPVEEFRESREHRSFLGLKPQVLDMVDRVAEQGAPK